MMPFMSKIPIFGHIKLNSVNYVLPPFPVVNHKDLLPHF